MLYRVDEVTSDPDLHQIAPAVGIGKHRVSRGREFPAHLYLVVILIAVQASGFHIIPSMSDELVPRFDLVSLIPQGADLGLVE